MPIAAATRHDIRRNTIAVSVGCIHAVYDQARCSGGDPLDPRKRSSLAMGVKFVARLSAVVIALMGKLQCKVRVRRNSDGINRRICKLSTKLRIALPPRRVACSRRSHVICGFTCGVTSKATGLSVSDLFGVACRRRAHIVRHG